MLDHWYAINLFNRYRFNAFFLFYLQTESNSSVLDEDIKLVLGNSISKMSKAEEALRRKVIHILMTNFFIFIAMFHFQIKFLQNTIKGRIRTKASQALPRF